MERSELFLLLPVYREAQGQPFYATVVDIMPEPDLHDFIGRIGKICDFLTHENYFGYYDAENVKAFMLPLEAAREYYPDGAMLLHRMLFRWGEDWRRSRQHRDDETFSYYGAPIANDTLCEITRRKNASSSDEVTYLLVNHGGMACGSGKLRTMHGSAEVEIEVRDACVRDIAEWFACNRRPARAFNWNPKHGEYGKGAYPAHRGAKVSVLRCGRGEAGELLKQAVGEEPSAKTLFYYDFNRGAYIEFKKERANTYHAFHLDDEDRGRIPERVKRKMEALFE